MPDLKRSVWSIDQRFFGGALFKVRSRQTKNKVSQRLGVDNNRRIKLYYNKNKRSELADLCDQFGSDKGANKETGHPYTWASHTYVDIYELMFGLGRDNVRLVVECGLGTNNPDLESSMGAAGKPGASLRVWRAYFPHADIVGIDIDQDILFEEDRIRTYQCDQTSPDSIRSFIARANLQVGTVDLFVDDGLHEFSAGKTLFEHSVSLLSDTGVYVIEDVSPQDLLLYSEYFARRATEYYARLVELGPHPDDEINNLVVITKCGSAPGGGGAT